MFLNTSSSFSRNPNAPPNATAAMMSRVRYCALRAKSMGLKSVDVETYSRSIRPSSLARQPSIACSRVGFFLPAYCQCCQHSASESERVYLPQLPFGCGALHVSLRFARRGCSRGPHEGHCTNQTYG